MARIEYHTGSVANFAFSVDLGLEIEQVDLSAVVAPEFAESGSVH